MLNQVQIIGHLGRDPEVRYMPNGDAVCNLAIATTEKWKDKNTGDPQEATEWHRVSMFGKLADICGQYLHKGSLVYVSGKLKTRKYTDKDGVEKYATEISANEMKMLGGRQNGDDQDQQQAPRQQQPQRQQPQPQRQAAPQQQRPAASQSQRPQGYQPPARQGSGGFDDMDDDIPFADPMKSRAFCLSI